VATSQAIAATGQAIIALLANACPKPEFAAATFELYQLSDFEKPMDEGVSLYLYRIATSGSRRNLPPTVGPNGERFRPPIPLDLHYIASAWAKTAVKQQRLLGWLIRLLEDVTITNVTMRDIVNSPIFLRLGSRMRGPQGASVGALQRIILSNIIVYNAEPKYGSIISGIPGHDIEDVRLNNIRIYYKGGGTKQQALLEPPEKENDYPEPAMFGEIPAYGFFIRHVRGIELRDVEVGYLKDDARSAFILSDVKAADLRHVKTMHAKDTPSFVLKDVEDFSIQQSQPLPDTNIKKVRRQQF